MQTRYSPVLACITFHLILLGSVCHFFCSDWPELAGWRHVGGEEVTVGFFPPLMPPGLWKREVWGIKCSCYNYCGQKCHSKRYYHGNRQTLLELHPPRDCLGFN